MRPSGPKDREQAFGRCWDVGRIRVWRYALDGEIRREVVDVRREVHCFNASLSEQDFERVGGASGRAYGLLLIELNWYIIRYLLVIASYLHGLRLTTPN